jgi:hypothetical protein
LAQLRDGHFQAQGEHQEGHPYGGHGLDQSLVAHPAQRVRADGSANHQVAQYYRLPESVGDHSPDQCRHQKNGETGNRTRFFHQCCLKVALNVF